MVDQVTDAQKLMVLCLLVLQNASVVIMGRYSRGVIKETYLGSTVVIMTEVTKMLISIFCIMRGMGNSHLNSKPWSLTYKLWWLIQNSGYTWVPATCYFIQNTLQYTAMENLGSAVYAVMAQMKILTAALFSYFILRKKLSLRKWRALVLLVVGGVLMENHTFEIHQSNSDTTGNTSDPVKGTIAIVAIVCLSGLAGVVAQLLLQNRSTQHSNGNDAAPPQMSLWDRNLQMSFWSIIFGGVALFYDRKTLLSNGGFFGGWTSNTWILVFLWAVGGILVALCIKYTDVIIKGFASAISLILISITGWFLLGDNLDLIFMLGAVITIIATFNYNEQDSKPPTTGTAATAGGEGSNGSTAVDMTGANAKEGVDATVEEMTAKVDLSPLPQASTTTDVSTSINNIYKGNLASLRKTGSSKNNTVTHTHTHTHKVEKQSLLRNTDD